MQKYFGYLTPSTIFEIMYDRTITRTNILGVSAMKFYILGTFISLTSCITVNEKERTYLEIICTTDYFLNIATCGKGSTEYYYLPKLPIDTIPLGVESIIMKNDFYKPSEWKWQIIDHNMFHDFENLTTLHLEGPVRYSEPYYREPMKSTLLDELFELPRLTTLELEDWELNPWKFPVTLQNLNLIKFNGTHVDLDKNRNLISVNITESKLKNMPKLFTPPPPIEKLILRYNKDIQFNVYDIVDLCQLRDLAVNVFNANFENVQKYCECQRLLDYTEQFKIATNNSIRCDNARSIADCKDYSWEKPKEMHIKKCLPEEDLRIGTTPANELWLRELGLFASFFVILFSVIFFFIISVISL